MNAATHTPGPWGIDHGHAMEGNGRYWQVHDGQDAICCNQFCFAPNSEANARLIAAAPDLVEIVRDIVSDCKGIINPGLYDLAVATIAKAEGRS